MPGFGGKADIAPRTDSETHRRECPFSESLGLQKVEMRLSDSLGAVPSHLARGPRPGAVARIPRPGNSLAGAVCPGHETGEDTSWLPGWDPNTRTDKGSPGHTVTKRPKIHRPQAMSASRGRVREGSIRSEISIHPEARRCQNPVSSRAGIDPKRSFKFAGANVRYKITKRSFVCRDQLGS